MKKNKMIKRQWILGMREFLLSIIGKRRIKNFQSGNIRYGKKWCRRKLWG